MSLKSSVGERIRSLRESKNMSQLELSSLVPMSQAALHRIESGEVNKSGKMVQIAAALGTTAEYLQTGTGFIDEAQSSKKIPILKWGEIKKWIAADSKEPLFKEEEREFIYPPKFNINSRQAYALRIEGDSMESASGESLNVGDYVIIDPEKKEKSGDIIIYNFPSDKSPIIRKLIVENKNYLIPLNKYYRPQIIPDTENSCGVVVSKVSIFNR